jgi:hypothetical protein
LNCAGLRADAAGLASLPPEAPERREAQRHAAACPDCARALRQAERLQALLLDGAGASAPTVAPLSRTRTAIGAELRRARAARPWSAVALAGAAAVAGALAILCSRHVLSAADPVVPALGLGVLALVAALSGAVRPLAATVLGAAAAVVFAVLTGWDDPGSLLRHPGWICAGEELAAALLPLGVAAGAVWRGVIPPAALAPAAAAGALAAQAALHLTCPAPRTEAHLLIFHAGGVVLAAAIGAVLGEVWRRRPA